MDSLALLVSVLIASILGGVVGASAGLVPGLHINNIAYLLASSPVALGGSLAAALAWLGAGSPEAPLLVASMMVSSLVAHTFTSLLPSTFLGAPDPARALSVLPAHRMLLAGRGLEAVRCSLIGCAGGLAASLLALPLFRVIMGDPLEAYERIRPHLGLILILIVVVLIVSEPPCRTGLSRRLNVFSGAGDGRKARDAARRPPRLSKLRSGAPGPPGCVIFLERVRTASLALSESFMRGGGDGVRDIRPWEAPLHAGETVRVSGVVSVREEFGGRVSFVVEEGAAVEVVVPEGRESEAAGVSVGEIVVLEGRVAPAVDVRRGLDRRLLATALFLESGFLGVIVLSAGRVSALNWFPLGAPPIPDGVMLFPLLCGLFGLPALLLGAIDRPATPPQITEETPLPAPIKLRAVLTGTLAGGLIGWFPGMTSAHGAVIARLLTGGDEKEGQSDGEGHDGSGGMGGREIDDAGDREFLISVSAVAVANAFFNLVALFVILRARSGALHLTRAVLGESLLAWWPAASVPGAFALLVVSAAVGAALALPITLILGRALAGVYDRVPYRKLQLVVLALLVALLLIFSGAAGLVVAGVALCLGLIPPLAGVRRVHLMGAILLPVTLFFLGADRGVISFLGL